MKLPVLIGSTVWILLCQGCELPFNTKTSSDGDQLKLEIHYDGRRIIDTLQVGLSWLELSVEYFKSYTIERKNIDAGDTVWTLQATLEDPFAVAYTDTVNDDATYLYRLRLYDENDDFRATEAQVTIRSTTRITVPTERNSITAAVNSPLIDNGDTVAVLAGFYSTGPIHFIGKSINLIGIAGANNTFLDAKAYNDSGGDPRPVITMAGGLVEGFTIQRGRAQFGGAIHATGSALIRQCTIANNVAIIASRAARGGFGGAIYIADSARVENCLIQDNSADKYGGAIYATGGALIRQCTILDNRAGMDGGAIYVTGGVLIRQCTILDNSADKYGGAIYATGGALIRQCTIAYNVAAIAPGGAEGGFGGAIYIADSARVENCLIRDNRDDWDGGAIYIDGLYAADSRVVNCTIYNNYPSGISTAASAAVSVSNSIVWSNSPEGDIKSSGSIAVEYTDYKHSASTEDSTNLNVDPAFVDVALGDFHLQDDSECIDAGNPAQEYNDPDGSNNDMGCFGGPGGDWLAPLNRIEFDLGYQSPWSPGSDAAETTWR